MFLTKLTMRGFKSFADRTEVDVEPGVTVVVGPNGSGKSNIVDALSWVLGTASPRKVRGGSMQDVIFAGSPSRPAAGLARVEITIDNSHGLLGTDALGTAGSAQAFAEVRIARELTSAGDSRYQINGVDVRAMDVQELLSDAGLGRELHTIVGQGQLDAILNARPEERRAYIEEAAGILKHRRRRERAVRKLDQVEGHVDKLAIVLRELRRELRPLERQAEAAGKAARLRTELDTAKVRLAVHDHARLAGAVAAGADEDSATSARLAEVEQRAGAERRRVAALEEHLAEERPAAESAGDAFHRLQGLRERLRGTADLVDARRRHLLEFTEEPLAGRPPEELRAQAGDAASRAAEREAERDAARGTLEHAQQARRAVEHERREHERQRQAEARLRAEAREARLRWEGEVQALRGATAATTAELGRVAAQQDQTSERLVDLDGDVAAVHAELQGYDVAEVELTNTLEASEAAFESASSRREALRDQERELERERSSQGARAEALRAALVDRGGAARALVDSEPDVVAVADVLHVADDDRTAVAAALGDLADAVVVPSHDRAAALLARLVAEELGRATILVADGRDTAASNTTASDTTTPDTAHVGDELDDRPSSAADGRRLVSLLAVRPRHELLDRPDVVGGAGAGSATVDLPGPRDLRADDVAAVTGMVDDTDRVAGHPADGGAHGTSSAPGFDAPMADTVVAAVIAATGPTVVVADVSEAREAVARDAAVRAVTRSGEVVDGHAFTGGVAPLDSTVATASAAQDAQARADAAEETLGQVTAEAADADTALDQARARLRDATLRINESDARITAAAERLGRVHREREALQRQHELVAAQHDELRAVLARDEDALAALVRRGVVADEPDEAAEQAAEAEQTRLEEALEEAREAELDARVVLERIDEQLRHVRRSERELREEADEVERALAVQARRREQRRLGIVRCGELAAIARDTLDALDRAVVEARSEKERLSSLVRQRSERLAEAREALERHAAQMEDVRSVRHEAELVQAERVRDLAAVVEGLHVAHQLTPEEASKAHPGAAEEDRDELVSTVDVLERKLGLLGRVNPLALEQFEALQQRHTFMAEQLKDLRQSRRDLEKVVVAVDEQIQRVFAEAFDDVAREFQTTFQTVFPGGEGRLVLTDPDDLLASGVEVEARPPGKKVTRLSLLSGGERSLTVLAFVFAIFRARPSPFYVLDEVDAALDDVNLQRLLRVLSSFKERAQLLVVTHQKRSMEIADVMYGVTMGADAVTRVVAERFTDEDVEQLLATANTG